MWINSKWINFNHVKGGYKNHKSSDVHFVSFERIRLKKTKNSVKNGFRQSLRQRLPGKIYIIPLYLTPFRNRDPWERNSQKVLTETFQLFGNVLYWWTYHGSLWHKSIATDFKYFTY